MGSCLLLCYAIRRLRVKGVLKGVVLIEFVTHYINLLDSICSSINSEIKTYIEKMLMIRSV